MVEKLKVLILKDILRVILLYDFYNALHMTDGAS
jgi:hypothetical protein